VHFRRLGLATLVGMSLTILGGIMAKYSNTFRNYIRPINIKLYHATAGMVIFMLAMVVASLATYSNWFHNRMGKVEWVGRICMWAPIILAVCVARQVTQSYLPRILEPRQSELDAKAKAIQAKIDAKLKNEKVRKDN
jgi:cytochrome b-561 domain-containing protein 2